MLAVKTFWLVVAEGAVGFLAGRTLHGGFGDCLDWFCGSVCWGDADHLGWIFGVGLDLEEEGLGALALGCYGAGGMGDLFLGAAGGSGWGGGGVC